MRTNIIWGEADLFSQASREDVNATAVRYLLSFMKHLLDDPAENNWLCRILSNWSFGSRKMIMIRDGGKDCQCGF